MVVFPLLVPTPLSLLPFSLVCAKLKRRRKKRRRPKEKEIRPNKTEKRRRKQICGRKNSSTSEDVTAKDAVLSEVNPRPHHPSHPSSPRGGLPVTESERPPPKKRVRRPRKTAWKAPPPPPPPPPPQPLFQLSLSLSLSLLEVPPLASTLSSARGSRGLCILLPLLAWAVAWAPALGVSVLSLKPQSSLSVRRERGHAS